MYVWTFTDFEAGFVKRLYIFKAGRMNRSNWSFFAEGQNFKNDSEKFGNAMHHLPEFIL